MRASDLISIVKTIDVEKPKYLNNKLIVINKATIYILRIKVLSFIYYKPFRGYKP